MLAEHLYDQSALCFVKLILDADVASFDRRFAAPSFVRSPFEDRLQSLCDSSMS